MTFFSRITAEGLEVFDRNAAIEFLVERDGLDCTFPGCMHEFSADSGSPWHRTIDHIVPQVRCKERGWTMQEMWDSSNLSLMHRTCNQRKGDVEYNEDGTLTLVEVIRTVKIARPDICATCYAGRMLGKDEQCPDCYSLPQPTTWPAYLQFDPRECAHDKHSHCRFCVPGFVKRIEPLAI